MKGVNRGTYPSLFVLAMAFLCTANAWTQVPAPPGSGKQSTTTARPNLSSSDLTPKTVEDFSTPALTSSSALGRIESLPLEIDDNNPQFTREVVRVQWRIGDPIDLYIVKPVGVKKPPVILYLFDYPAETDRYLNAEFCRLLTKQGFAAVGFVGAMTGQRYHDRPMKEWFVSELRESLATSAHDVQMILNYLAKREDVDMDRVGIFSEGSGAAIAILAAAVDPRIKSLDLVDPWGDWPDWIAKSTRVPESERPGFLKPEWLAAVAPLDPVKWLPGLKTQRIRLQFVKNLSSTPPDVQSKIELAAPSNAQIVHYDDLPAFRNAMAGGKAYDWIQQRSQSATAADYRGDGQVRALDSSSRLEIPKL
jgi:hypothetical protein